MWQRREGEAWVVWVLRQMVERPVAIVTVASWVAAAVLYADVRNFMREQTQAYVETATALRELSLRISQLENHPFHQPVYLRQEDRTTK